MAGSTQLRLTRSAFEKDISAPCYDKISNSLITLALEKSPQGSKLIPVSPQSQAISHQEPSTTSAPSDLVQQGISEKVPLVVNFLAAFVTGFVLAYIRNWRLALALSSILPGIAITGAVMNISVSKFMQYVNTSYYVTSSSLLWNKALTQAYRRRRKLGRGGYFDCPHCSGFRHSEHPLEAVRCSYSSVSQS